MNFKRIIYALLYSKGQFHLSRNFSLQKVGGIDWLKNNFGFGETCNFIDELIILDVTKNPNDSDKNFFLDDVNKLREKIFVPLTLGGGIRTFNDAKLFFDNGADKIMINYLAHFDKEICHSISSIFGNQALSVMVDYKIIDNKIITFINGGKTKSFNFNHYIDQLKNLKFGELILNSIDKDGTAAGLDQQTFKEIPDDLINPILIMGGAGKPEHFVNTLRNDKISGIVTANLFNFLGTGLKEARNFSLKENIKLINFEHL